MAVTKSVCLQGASRRDRVGCEGAKTLGQHCAKQDAEGARAASGTILVPDARKRKQGIHAP